MKIRIALVNRARIPSSSSPAADASAEPARDKSPPERRQLGEAQRLGRDLDEGALSGRAPMILCARARDRP